MKMVKYYLIGALVAALFAWFSPWLILSIVFWWIALSLTVVSSAYIFGYPSLFRKRNDGSIPFYVRWMFIPFLLGTDAYNSWARKHDKVPPIQQIDDHLFLACRLFNKDIETLNQLGITAILDVTAEFDGLDWTAHQADCDYLNIPVLDHTSPTLEQLNTAINWLDQHISEGNKVVVHCALGRGRSVLTLAAYLLTRDDSLSVMDAMNKIQSVRSTARLNKRQLKSLTQIKQGGRLKLLNSLILVANPVAGGGKWEREKENILAQLNPHFRVSVFETKEDLSATTLTKKAIQKGADIVVACGGDGTISEVARQCLETNTILGVIPLGTANALSQVLHGVFQQIDPFDTACQTIIEGKVTKIDTALCNDKLMLLAAAVGFEEKMIATADRSQKNEGGQMAYLKGLWDAIGKNETLHLEVKFDHEPVESLDTPSLVVANAAPITTALAQGGDEPDLTDGKLDITWLTPQENSDQQLLSLAELVFSDAETKKDSPRVNHKQASEVEISFAREREYALDGEIFKAEKIHIKILPKSLKILSDGQLNS
ncbi:diacylglycerol kinase family protein [Alteromonas ponticola]|uniref:Diacylglycerol kinase family protein n=1 Tax=Alteromonas aquimaris TaxID=2998417 RepID=A0ABT3P760_9ALTE|nr:diacylglycerol kinase family protein [Alteromonas aquimaris]MCW8108602.1 diacylglycerol kinase family protein [Alteromonas aquimaris]